MGFEEGGAFRMCGNNVYDICRDAHSPELVNAFGLVYGGNLPSAVRDRIRFCGAGA